MPTPFLPKITFALAAALSAFAGACVDPAATSSVEGEIGGNLVSTTYYDCNTGAIVGEKTSGCVSGPAAQSGRVTTCYEVDSETCDQNEMVLIQYCAFDNACEAFEFPDEPYEPYEEWLAAQR